MAGETEVRYRNRRTGEVVREDVMSGGLLRWFYETRPGRLVFGLFLNNRAVCRLCGRWQSSARSRRRIGPFVDRFGIDAEEVERPPAEYESFNAFFSRRLKPDARPFVPDPDVLCCPADGKVLVFPDLDAADVVPVKGACVAPAALLGADAGVFGGGSALVVRLAPYDYHRFHFPDDGEAGPARLIRGRFDSVNPIALAHARGVWRRNTRAVTTLFSARFGRVAYVEVGAFAVASIVQTYTPGAVFRGQEKGYFQFGGSTLVLLFEPGAIRFDADLVRDSRAGLEVQVRMGSRVGTRA